MNFIKSKTFIIFLVLSLSCLLFALIIYTLSPTPSNYHNFVLSDNSSNFDGDVIIVGAGASGLTAGYLLEQAGVNYTIIEAQQVYGGRLKENIELFNFSKILA